MHLIHIEYNSPQLKTNHFKNMNFKVGDTVILRVEKKYSDGTIIPAGTQGIVETVYPLSTSYLISFDGFDKSRRVLEADLE